MRVLFFFLKILKTKHGLKRHVAQHENSGMRKEKALQNVPVKHRTSASSLTIRDVISQENNSAVTSTQKMIKPVKILPKDTHALLKSVNGELQIQAMIGQSAELVNKPEKQEETIKQGVERGEMPKRTGDQVQEAEPIGNPVEFSNHTENEASAAEVEAVSAGSESAGQGEVYVVQDGDQTITIIFEPGTCRTRLLPTFICR